MPARPLKNVRSRRLPSFPDEDDDDVPATDPDVGPHSKRRCISRAILYLHQPLEETRHDDEAEPIQSFLDIATQPIDDAPPRSTVADAGADADDDDDDRTTAGHASHDDSHPNSQPDPTPLPYVRRRPPTPCSYQPGL
ncbi:hypothetical protein HK101_007140, partial [Irineochytrium annulatum]